jgi:hypothetical protein
VKLQGKTGIELNEAESNIKTPSFRLPPFIIRYSAFAIHHSLFAIHSTISGLN